METDRKLDVLLVEDNPDDLNAYLRDFPSVFASQGISVKFHTADTFQKAEELVKDGSRRFDLILSDTYRGDHKNHDAAVLKMIDTYRAGRFCPLVVFSASAMPEELRPSAFVAWADKTETDGIEKTILKVLSTGVSQAARILHDELDGLAGNYLWKFLEERWDQLVADGDVVEGTLTRMIRRRAAVQLGNVVSSVKGDMALTEVQGHEVYLYPPINKNSYSLGEVIRKGNDMRVILTPHCFLTVQPGQARPRADYVVTVKTVPVSKVLGDKAVEARSLEEAKKIKKIRTWITPPSNDDVGKPAGRYWYMPGFLDISHSYCDFLQVESLEFEEIEHNWTEIAVISPPFAESLQACYGAFHGSVGIPTLAPASVANMLS